jgi:hypothetical protein
MTTPAVLQTNPLPRLGHCPGCGEEIRVRIDGTLRQHDRYGVRCPGSRRPVGLLEPTFVRWLHANAPRKDAHTNRITSLAQHLFNACGRTPRRAPIDMTWTTAVQLHQHLHRHHKRMTGSENRGGIGGERCDWACRDVMHAADAYNALISAAARDAT